MTKIIDLCLTVIVAVIISGFIALLIFSNEVHAADLQITCDLDACTSTSLVEPLFEEVDVKPLDEFVRTVEACNTDDDEITFAMELQNYVDSDPAIGEVLSLTIIDEVSTNTVLGPSSLAEIQTDGYIMVGGVDPDSCRTYEFIVQMANVGNDYQQKELAFDLALGFDALPGEVLGETTTPTPTSSEKKEILGIQLPETGYSLVIPASIGILIMVLSLLLWRRTQRINQKE